jgi:hypothetical protein
LLSIGLGFVPFWLGVPRTMALAKRRGLVVQSLGTLSAFAAALVALTPSDRLPWLHQISVLAAAGAGVAAALIASTGRAVAAAPRTQRLLSWAALTTAALDAGLYLAQVLNPQPCAIALPILQKLAAALVLAWMLSTAIALAKSSPAEGPAREPR